MTTVHAQPEYQIRPAIPAPPGYPAAPVADSFAETPFLPTYAERRRAFLEHVCRNPAPANTKATWFELARMAAGGTPHAGIIQASMDFIDARRDCSDFVLHGILRLLYQFLPVEGEALADPAAVGNVRRTARLDPAVFARARQTVLNFKYFPNEPGLDSLCTWTENHYILFTSAAYLAGQLYPDEVFPNSGETGRQKMALNRPRILRWLDLRFRTGFSEWLSHVYYDEDLTALLDLYDFAADSEIRCKAAGVIDLLLLDMALNSFKGVFGSTHGRAYANTKRWPFQEGTTDTAKLLFGTGIFSGFDNMSAVAFALSEYQVPPVIESIACHPGLLLNRQRMGIRVGEAGHWGLEPEGLENGMHLLTLEAYLHPRTARLTLEMFDTCRWWENRFFSDFKTYRPLLRLLRATHLLGPLVRSLEWDVCRNTREQVDILTYRTPDYMLSSAPDYRPGYGGDQQHIWQATLGPGAVCFTTHPGRPGGPTPDEWAGSGVLPRVAQAKNVLIAVYHIHHRPALYVPTRHFSTHAWLPERCFDEVVEADGWIFARQSGRLGGRTGEAYLGLRSQHPYVWNSDPQEEGRCEVVCASADNIWLCELGSRAENGSFERFTAALRAAPLAFDGRSVTYHSPSQGVLRFGWTGPFTRDGQLVDLHPEVRYDNPFVQAAFDPVEIQVTAGEHALRLNGRTGEREIR